MVLPPLEKIQVWELQGGTYECKSCVPPIHVKSDGRDQPVTGQLYDTVSIEIVNGRTIREIEKKSGQVASDETFSVAADGRTLSDLSAEWNVSMERVSNGPVGSHALSGSWRILKWESALPEGLITYRLVGDILTMSNAAGQSFKAKLGGPDAAYVGDPTLDGVSVVWKSKDKIEETDKRNGKVVSTVVISPSTDGKTMTIEATDVQSGAVNHLTAEKQWCFRTAR